MPQETLTSFDTEEEDGEDVAKRINDKLYQVRDKYGNRVGIELLPFGPRPFRKTERIITDEKKYRILLGREEQYNWGEYLNQRREDNIELHRINYFTPKAYFYFSATTDDFGDLQSDHLFLSGMMGKGKTNLCSLIAVGFTRRPNPTTTLWVSQKSSTAHRDFKSIGEFLDLAGKNYSIVDFADDKYRIPISVFNIDQVMELLGMKTNTAAATMLRSIYRSQLEGGSGIKNTLEAFIETSYGKPYRSTYYHLQSSNLLAFTKSDALDLKKNHTYLVTVSDLMRKEPNRTVDLLVTGWCDYLYTEVSKDRRSINERYVDSEKSYRKQWQGMIIFDEFHHFMSGERFLRTAEKIAEIGVHGRQEGTSLVLASQTLYYGGKREKQPITQASKIFQFYASYNTDMNFILNTMGWTTNQYEKIVREIFAQIFSPASNEDFKGKIILFDRNPRNTSPVRVIQLELFSNLKRRAENLRNAQDAL